MNTADVVDANRIQLVRDGVALSERLIGLVKDFAEKSDPGSAYHITALRKALTATIIHINVMEATGQPYKPSIELNDLCGRLVTRSKPMIPYSHKLAEKKLSGG